jgi:hypothetical protein
VFPLLNAKGNAIATVMNIIPAMVPAPKMTR